MAPKMREALPSLVTKTRARPVKTIIKHKHDLKAMIGLEAQLDRIRKARIDKNNWDKYWLEFEKWEVIGGSW